MKVKLIHSVVTADAKGVQTHNVPGKILDLPDEQAQELIDGKHAKTLAAAAEDDVEDSADGAEGEGAQTDAPGTGKKVKPADGTQA